MLAVGSSPAVWKDVHRICRKEVALAIIGTGAVYCALRWRRKNALRQKAISKRCYEQEYIKQKLRSLGSELDDDLLDEILKLSGVELLEKLRDKTIDPVLVLKAYIYKACQTTEVTNSVTEIIKGCEEDAAKLSQKNPNTMPLYGMPVSVKECARTKGTPSCAGMVMYIDDIPDEDCPLVQVLRHCGAIPFAKTNSPQIMFSFESSNPIYGETTNHLNPDFAPGGSSSGEGALVGAGGSILGFGTDIAGSIRMPSQFSGICGLKPTKHRISISGLTGCLPGQNTIASSIGPMARDVDTLVLAMRALLCEKMFELDPYVPRMKFNEEVYSSKDPLRIGYYEDDGYMKPIPACQRAVRITKAALEKAGHTLVPYKVPDLELMMEMATRAFYIDGGRTNMERLKDDVVDRRLLVSWRRWRTPDFIRKIQAFFLKFHSSRMAKDLLAYGGGQRTVFELYRINAWVHDYKTKFWAEWREKYKIDALICPVYPLVACPRGEVSSMTELMSYSTPYTLTNCAAGAVTITKVTEKDICDLEHHIGHYGDAWDLHVKRACKGSIDMPVAVQCVAPPWEEELCLRLMKEVETLLVSS